MSLNENGIHVVDPNLFETNKLLFVTISFLHADIFLGMLITSFIFL